MDPLVSWQEQQKGNFLRLSSFFFAIWIPIGLYLSSYINVAYRSTFTINLSSERMREEKWFLANHLFFLLLNNNNNIQTKKKKKSRKKSKGEREREKMIVGTTINITAERKKREREGESIVSIYSHSPPLNPSSRPKEREKEIGLIIIAECVCCCCNAIKNSILFPSNMMSINRRNRRRYTYI